MTDRLRGMNTPLTNTADNYKKAYDALKEAEEALAKHRATLEADFALAGITRHATSDGHVVAIEEVNNRVFDIDTLRMVAPNAFDKVTALKVDTKKFDKAVASGDITHDAVGQVVSHKTHTRVTVGVAV
jgi:hypothetical protein